MERILSTEDKIRRAEEIYNKRRESQIRNGMTKVNINSRKDIKLMKKIFIQVMVCFAIYTIFYLIKNNNYIFSEDFINKSKEILSYDIDFQEIYNRSIENLKSQGIFSNDENIDIEDTKENKVEMPYTEENGIGGEENKETNQNENELSQMEQDALSIKNSINFINPIEGNITSEFGWRNPTTSIVPKFHTGLDIANSSGTKIYSSTDGKVVLASSEGDYRKSFKNTNS